MIIREYTDKDIQGMIEIWNEVVEEGIAFPQESFLDERSGKEFFGDMKDLVSSGLELSQEDSG